MDTNYTFEQMDSKIYERKSSGQKSGYSLGARKALWNYNDSKRHNSSEYEVTDLPNESDMEDFLSTLRIAKIATFVVTAKNTALIEALHQMRRLGCTVYGLDTITRNDTEYRVMGNYEVEGIRIML
ncbi:MAG TPA: hypothetical protein P5092_14445 [Ruminococcus sp.]|nr:hypothetical protein [Ruminococcus sp.]